MNLPDTQIAQDEVKIRVYSCGICGSDIHEYKNGPLFWLPSRVGGHEFGGEIIAKGGAIHDFEIGDKVVFKLGYECNECYYCKTDNPNLCEKNYKNLLPKGGGFAEFVVVGARQVVKLPDNFCEDKISLVEPLAVVIHASKKIDVYTDDYILIIGSGTLAILLLRWLKKCNPNCKIILFCKYDYIASLAKNDCIVIDLRTFEYSQLISRLRIKYAFVCAGSVDSFDLAYNHIIKGGKIINLSIFCNQINMDLSDLMFGEKTIEGSFLYSRKEFIQSMKVLYADEIDLSKIISGCFPLLKINVAFDELIYNRNNHLKVLINPNLS